MIGTSNTIGRYLALAFLLFLPVRVNAFQPRTFPLHNTRDTTRTAPNKNNNNNNNNNKFDANDALDILSKEQEAGIPASHDATVTAENENANSIDLEKARDLASHYGKYSYEEIETMRDDLHADRVKNDSPNDVLFLERYLEDELTSQLKALQDESPEPYLFEYPHEMVSPSSSSSPSSSGLFPERLDVVAAAVAADAADNVDDDDDEKKMVDEVFAASLGYEIPETTSSAAAAAFVAVEPEKTTNGGFDISDLLLHEGVMEGLAICVVVAFYALITQ